MFNKMLIIASMLCTLAVSAKDGELIKVKIAPSSLMTAEESKSTIFHVTIPVGPLVTTVYGGDEIEGTFENYNSVKTTKSSNSAIWELNSTGVYSLALTTKCRQSLSIVANVIKINGQDKAKLDGLLPKVAIESAGCAATKKNL